jgi:quercetin dioxygenase-like cupin family protein
MCLPEQATPADDPSRFNRRTADYHLDPHPPQTSKRVVRCGLENETRISRRSEERVFAKRDHFNGDVAFVMNLRKDLPFDIGSEDSIHLVSFADGAHTRLHRHSSRQVLIFAHGEGFVEQEGGQRWEVAAGDVIECAASIAHRHGARPGSDCVHIAIQSGEAEWLE